ncbi:MAG: GNAT family N-acetyltransferase [Thiohalomonadales bacterium]
MIEYVNLSTCNSAELISILNSEDVRKHLMPHEQFNDELLDKWIKQKNACDAGAGCRIRGILIDQQLAGWCGIQNDPLGYEIAIILDKPFWGYGKLIFKAMLAWAKEFGHSELIIHLHESRASYQFLKKLSKNKVTKSVILGNKFNSYHIPVVAL